MTHSDIYTKFMIEYDKDSVTSSYPSLTKYEIATILDKAYLALIAQKVTGNNNRKMSFEADIKSIEDIRPLIKSSSNVAKNNNPIAAASNEVVYTLPEDLLYYVQSYIDVINTTSSLDQASHIRANITLINHAISNKFKSSDTNLPWIKEPVCYMEGNELRVLIDPYKYKNNKGSLKLHLTYIYKPAKFATQNSYDFSTSTKFELSDSMAEELINLAIVIAAENVELPRQQTKASLLSLES